MTRKIWISRDTTPEDYAHMWGRKPKCSDGDFSKGSARRNIVMLDEVRVLLGFTPKPGTCHEVIIDHSDVTPEESK